MKALLFLGCIVSFACSAAGDDRCEVSVSPTAEDLGVASAAADRIESATGCQVHLQKGGIPLQRATVPVSYQGENTCAITWVKFGVETRIVHRISSIEYQPNRADCESVENTLIHEFMHALVERPGTTEILPTEQHSETGVFSPVGGKLIDESTLSHFCGMVNCSVFKPEE